MRNAESLPRDRGRKIILSGAKDDQVGAICSL